MDPFLIRLLFLINLLQAVNTIVNVIHKLKYIEGPKAHIAIAILSTLILLGYSGILNTIFLQRKFQIGRIIYMIGAIICQIVILLLSFLALYDVITYFDAIAIIHAILGFVVMVNFTCAVLVVDEQQKQLQNEKEKKTQKKKKTTIKKINWLFWQKNKHQEMLQRSSVRQSFPA